MCPRRLSRVLCALRWVVFAGLAPAFTVAMLAQTITATNTTIEIGGGGVGLLQAPDGNFYSPSTPNLQPCIGNTSMYCGYIYKVTPSGAASAFYTFQPVSTASPVATPNTDGLPPVVLIVGTDGNFYGAAMYGGPTGLGTIFKIDPSGKVFTILKSFGASGSQADPGNTPNGLIQGSDGNLYFTNGNGLYQLTLGGVLSTIYTFKTDPTTGIVPFGNNANSLVQGSDGLFYVTVQGTPGALPGGGGQTVGGIVKITPTGDIFLVHAFAADGSEGDVRGGPLVEGSDGNFYGLTPFSGTGSKGGVAFKVTPGGSLTVLNGFSGNIGAGNSALFVGGDGNFYGATLIGGDTTSPLCAPKGCGTVFQLTPSGTLTTLHNFEGGGNLPGTDGAGVETPLVQANDGLFYGTTFQSVFKLTPTPAVPAPVQVTVNPTKVFVNNPVTITWKVLNAFSLTAQQCGATVTSSTNSSGPGTWLGAQTGTFSGGVLSGSATITPTKGGMYTYALTCGGVESGSATLKVIGPLTVPASLPDGLVSSPYIIPPDAFDGTAPYTTTVTSGALPPGMGIDPSTGVPTGNPQQYGTFTFGLQVIDSASPPAKASGTTTLNVKRSLAIANGIVLKGAQDTKYYYPLTAIAGVKPYTWSITAGTLPDGITLNSSTGELTGTPTQQTTTPTPTITIQVTDAEGTPDKTTVTLPFVILPPPPIASVEFTQAIQQYQTLTDLETSLSTNGEPPVPIISNKPAVMRIYFTEVTSVTTLTVQVAGVMAQTQTIDVQPNCDPDMDQRGLDNGCVSLDFYFTPPSGQWTATLTVTDTSGNQLEQEILTVTSRDTATLNLKSATVCDTSVSKNCGNPALLGTQISVASKLMPTANVTLQASGATVSGDLTSYHPFPPAQYQQWDIAMSIAADALYTAADAAADSAANQRTTYFGIYNSKFGMIPPLTTPVIDYSGWAGGIPSHGAIGPDKAPVFGTDDAPAGVAHETGHTLNLQHTNLGPNPPDTASPGCYGKAPASSTYWTQAPLNFTTNTIQSASRSEFGFDVAAMTVINPFNPTFDLMSYCTPQWISPVNYKRMITILSGGDVSSPSVSSPTVHAEARTLGQPRALAQPLLTPTIVNGAYSQIEGTIDPNTGLTFDPVFTQTMSGSPDAGSGTYQIQLRNASGATLYTRYFTPNQAVGDLSDGTGMTSDPYFSEWVPVTAGTASFVILDQNENTIGTLPVTGTAPTVAITSPTAGFVGSTTAQPVSWTITDPDSASFFSRVFYSTDGGTTWVQIGETTGTSDTEDFTSLPGSTNALMRVLVSDGVNTGSATSVPFSVPRKTPSSIVINTPINGTVRPATVPVYLSGNAYDADDGFLTGPALQWSSSVQGALGSGSTLTANLTPGSHTITLTGKDSDGNVISTSITITIAGARPTLTLTTATNASNCINATISANPGVQGANLTQVQYSINGGASYIGIPLGSLPFTLTVPGTGTVNFVARAYDASGQAAAQSTMVSIPAACAQIKANPVITWTNPAAITYGTPLGSAQLNASASVPGVFSYSPAAGTVLGVGSQTLNTTFTPTDAVNYAVVISTTTLTVTQAASTSTLQLSAASILVGSAETLTVTVSSGVGTPTGTISFHDGATVLGSVPLANGQASFTAGTLAAGVHTLNASYSGDANFAASNGSASVTVSAAPTDFAFAIGNAATQTVQEGQVANYSFSLTPMTGGYPAAVTFTVSGLPSGATATFTPSSIPANGAAQSVILSIQTPAKQALDGDRLLNRKLTPIVLAFVLLPIAVWRHKQKLRGYRTLLGSSLLTVIAAVALCVGFTGCGGKETSSTQTSQSYSLVVTATSGAVQHSSTLTLIIQ
jgi:uncharacterized repeat protein (TIGR03803 family)